MQQYRNAIIKFALIASAAMASSASHASALDFDCDALPDHTSSVTQAALGPDFSVSGRLSIIEKRSGRFLPLAGVLIMPAESKGSDFVGFQIAGTRDGKSKSDVTFRDHEGRDSISRITTIEDSGEKKFQLSLTSKGDMILLLGESSQTINVPRIASWSRVKVVTLCSTGQFKFFDIAITPQSIEARK